MKKVEMPNHLETYFMELKSKHGIELTHGQRKWYFRQWGIIGDKIKQEYPSTAQEAFMASADAYFYANEIMEARKDRRVIPLRYDPEHLVYVSFDLGVFDYTVMWFYQVYDQNTYFIDYYEDHNKAYDFYIKFMLTQKHYHYGTVFLPHDSAKRDDVTLLSYADKVRNILSEKHVDVMVLKKDDPISGINISKVFLNRCYIDSNKCAQGLEHLQKYKRKWKEGAGWIHEPLDNKHSHAADSFRYAVISMDMIKNSSKNYLDMHKKAVESVSRLI